MSRDGKLLWQRAASVAARFHHGQTRKDGKTPYVAHPLRVAMTVRDVFGVDDPVALAAALLHDVIADTTADYDDLEKEFGPQVADVVAALTKDMRRPEATRSKNTTGNWPPLPGRHGSSSSPTFTTTSATARTTR